MAKLLLRLSVVVWLCIASAAHAQQWWREWETHPKVPEISASVAKKLVLAGEKVLFVYAGYSVPRKLCGSLTIPYTLVPPSADGSRLNLSNIPKDSWIFCYCP